MFGNEKNTVCPLFYQSQVYKIGETLINNGRALFRKQYSGRVVNENTTDTYDRKGVNGTPRMRRGKDPERIKHYRVRKGHTR